MFEKEEAMREHLMTGAAATLMKACVLITVAVASCLLEAGEARTFVLNEAVRLYAAGEYPQALAEIDKVKKLLDGTSMADEAVLLRAQIVAFTKMLDKVYEAVRVGEGEGLLRALMNADTIDTIIAPRGSVWRTQSKKIRAWGYYLSAVRSEKRDRYGDADGWYRKCFTEDPERMECAVWMLEKPKLIQKLFLKAQLYQDYDPVRASELYRDICRMTELTDEFNRKAQKALAVSEERR